MPPRRQKQQAKFVNTKCRSAAGSHLKDKHAPVVEWSDSSSSESSETEDNVEACSTKCQKKVLTIDIDTIAAQDTAPAPAVEALVAKDGAEDKTPAPAVEALALKDGGEDETVVCVNDMRCDEVLRSPTRMFRVGGRSPSPIKPARDFVPSSVTPSACASPINAQSKVTWHAPLVVSYDGPASKRPKTSRQTTPKTPEA